jgi:RNA polymerase sigma factor FliA
MACPQTMVYGETEFESKAERRERLILEHIPHVRYIARKLHERLPASFCLDDLVSAGFVGLITAIDNFDPSQNVKLATYASHRIRGAIMDSIRNDDGAGPLRRREMKRIQAASDRLAQRLGRHPGEEEVAAELGLDLDEYRDLLMDNRSVTVGSLDAAPSNTQDLTFAYYLADKSENQPPQLVEQAEMQRLVADGLRKMPVLARQVLCMYYVQHLTLREIGRIMKLHTSRISQLKTLAVPRLRMILQQHSARPPRASARRDANLRP